jgi:hypothetical protein
VYPSLSETRSQNLVLLSVFKADFEIGGVMRHLLRCFKRLQLVGRNQVGRNSPCDSLPQDNGNGLVLYKTNGKE